MEISSKAKEFRPRDVFDDDDTSEISCHFHRCECIGGLRYLVDYYSDFRFWKVRYSYMYTLSRWLRCHGGFHGSTDNSDIPAATVEKSWSSNQFLVIRLSQMLLLPIGIQCSVFGICICFYNTIDVKQTAWTINTINMELEKSRDVVPTSATKSGLGWSMLIPRPIGKYNIYKAKILNMLPPWDYII